METFSASFIFLTIVLISVISIGYFVVIGYIITQMDTRYFLRKKSSSGQVHQTPQSMSLRRVMGHFASIIKIIFGLFLLMFGVAMLILPGQGLLTMLIGLSLIPFPGKNRIEQNLLSRKSVRYPLNWIRIKARKEPFIFD